MLLTRASDALEELLEFQHPAWHRVQGCQWVVHSSVNLGREMEFILFAMRGMSPICTNHGSYSTACLQPPAETAAVRSAVRPVVPPTVPRADGGGS